MLVHDKYTGKDENKQWHARKISLLRLAWLSTNQSRRRHATGEQHNINQKETKSHSKSKQET